MKKGIVFVIIGLFIVSAIYPISAGFNHSNKDIISSYSLETESNQYSIVEMPDNIIWDNGGTIPLGSIFSSQLDISYPFNSQVADDFLFDNETLICGVHWWGGFWGIPEPEPIDFNIYFYADDGSSNAPTGGGMENPETTALASYFCPDVPGLPKDENGFNEYHVNLTPCFSCESGEKYWIVVQAFYDIPPQWGWGNTNGNQLSLAVQGFPLLGTDFWTIIESEVDMAFYLTSEEPAVPDLECNGDIDLRDIYPGETVNSSFQVLNLGDPGSLLSWEIIEWPKWGEWNFTPSSGDDLPSDNALTVEVTIIAPDKQMSDFIGQITVVNKDNLNDTCTIDITLSTPKNNPFNYNFHLLDLLLDMFPLLQRLLSVLGIQFILAK